MSQELSDKKMSMVCEASGLVRKIAYPATGKAALLRAYRRLGTWSYNRVKDVYYADRRIKISGEEIDKLRVIARKEMASNELSIMELRGQLAIVAQHLQRIDPTFRNPLAKAIGRRSHSEGGADDTQGGTDGGWQ